MHFSKKALAWTWLPLALGLAAARGDAATGVGDGAATDTLHWDAEGARSAGDLGDAYTTAERLDARSRADGAPTITSGSPPAGKVGAPYRFRVSASGVPSPQFSATGLPAGLTIATASGLISGTPTVSGTTTLVLVAGNGVRPNASASYLLTIQPGGNVGPSSAAMAPTLTIGSMGLVALLLAGYAVPHLRNAREWPHPTSLSQKAGSETIPPGLKHRSRLGCQSMRGC